MKWVGDFHREVLIICDVNETVIGQEASLLKVTAYMLEFWNSSLGKTTWTVYNELSLIRVSLANVKYKFGDFRRTGIVLSETAIFKWHSVDVEVVTTGRDFTEWNLLTAR